MKGLPTDIIPTEILDLLEFKTVQGDSPVPRLTKIHHQPHPCEDCGMTVTDRRIDIRWQRCIVNSNQDMGSEPRHWAQQCMVCKLKRNPDTGKFDIPINEYPAFLKRKFNNKDK